MKTIFYVTWIWYIACIIVRESIIMSETVSLFVGFMISLNLTFLVVCTVLNPWFSSKLVTYIDVRYSKACIATIITRMIIMSLAVWGIREIHWLVICNCSTLLFYWFLETQMGKFSNEKWIDVIDERENNYRL